MAVYSRRSADQLLMPSKWSERSDQQSLERSAIWPEQPKCNSVVYGSVPVVYYLSRNGQLDHPHFIQVPLSSPHGLFLRDVLIKLNFIRGNGMAYMYSWSSKRSYKNGYVWQDLAEDDFIRPTNDRDYILKGSELQSPAAAPVRSLQPATTNDAHDSSIPRSSKSRQKIQSWSTFENSIKINNNNNLDECRQVCKCESSRELGGAKSVDMGTQTEAGEARRRKSTRAEVYANKSVALSRENLSPPSMSSSEGLDGVSGSGHVDHCASVLDPMVENECTSTSGRSKPKPPRVLKQLINCASTARDCGGSIKQKKNGYKLRPKCGRTVLRDVVDR